MTYLEIPTSGRQPRQHDWEILIAKVSVELSKCKVKFLSLGGRLALVNFVLSTIPSYLMSMFKLPHWVLKAINHIRRDLLRLGSDIDDLGPHLVNWEGLCKSKEKGEWGILNLEYFIMVLLGKW